MDFLELFNAVARAVRPAHQEYKDVTDMDMPLQDAGLDSMDALMMGIYFCDIYGIPEEIGKEMQPRTPREFQEFLEKHKTKPSPTSVKEAMQEVDW